MAEPYKCRWGILATGGIASVFTKDLLVDPATRGVADVQHVVAAAASSTSAARAQQFLAACGAPAAAAAYGSYDELVRDATVDVVYVATPHSHHFAHVLLALRAGKHVVCEKPLTVNAAQARILADAARAAHRFLMEAVWTRFFPLSGEVRALVRDGAIGAVTRVHADLSLAQDPDRRYAGDAAAHRMVNPALAGGALLDLGIYPLTWVFQTLYHAQPAAARAPPAVSGAMARFAPTGVDAENVVVCAWPHATGVATSSIRVSTGPTAVRIYGTQGEIQVAHPAYRPTSITVITRKEPVEGKEESYTKEFPQPGGHGMFWEADAAARCIRDGKLECETMPLEESLVIMETMDKIREIAGLRYPEEIESTAH